MKRLSIYGASLLFNIVFYVVTAGYSILGYINLRIGRPDRLIPVGRSWARFVIHALRIICGIRVRVSGLEHVPASGAALIASVHQSAFDTAVWMLLPRPAYVLKRELVKVPFFGACMRPGGMIVVDRQAGARAIRDLMRDGREARADGRQVVIFPQGTRARPGEPHVIQPGVAALAAAMAVPVIPVATNSGEHWGRNSFLKHPGVIRIAIGAPLAADLPRAHLVEALEAAWRTLEDKLARPVDNPVGDVVAAFASRAKESA
ncbi:MAG: 1-acyl-sn-glycerol-3-phosphate acyltransferase [Proteobacteria bacterium]|nr:1-acyl-sn-glycerol-3-phosphate acyltransferase [Pseudomonadota bacterium]